MTPTLERAMRTNSGLATELRLSVARLSRRLRSERTPDNVLGVGSLSALGVLYRNQSMTIGALAEAERVKPPSMTRTVNCLEEHGLIARRPDADDKRVVMIELTDRGREFIHAERRRRDAWLAQRLRELTPAERDTLRAAAPILERLATG